MKKLKFGDEESLEYKEAKKMEEYDYFDEHRCGCDLCEYVGCTECPYCEKICDRYNVDDDTCDDNVAECSMCGKIAFRDYYMYSQNRKIINNFEKS